MEQRPILIIEDEKEIQRFLSFSFESHGYKPILASTAKEGLQQMALCRPDVIVLDLGLPDMDGHSVIQRIREWSNIPILVLSARSHESEKIKALEAGADDYLTKPFGLGELLARIKVALRHSDKTATTGSEIFEQGDLWVDLSKRLVKVAGEDVHLTPIEYQLLVYLVKHAGKVLTHSQILKEVWGKYANDHNNSLRIHLQHLRQKIKDNPLSPTYIMTETGIGYRLKTD